MQYRFHAAFSRCNNNLLPQVFIPPEILEKVLNLLSAKLVQKQMQISTSFNSKIAYQLPITTCSFTDTKIIIRVDVPIEAIQPSLTLNKVITFPLSSKNQTCTLNIIDKYILMADSHVIQVQEHDMHYCLVSPRPFLCKIPTIQRRNLLLTTCILRLKQSTVIGQLRNICPLICTKEKSFSIHLISAHRYALINPPDNLRLVTPNNTYLKIIAPNANNLFANIPCGYSLTLGNES